jgi:hypothetical protein
MTIPRLGQENIICAFSWRETELHQDRSWYTRAYSGAQNLIGKLESLEGSLYTAYVCDTFNRPDAITYMDVNGFTVVILNCGHETESYELRYPR